MAKISTTATASTAGTLRFSGYRWKIKSSSKPLNPGNNFFTSTTTHVFVDNDGMLHLRIDKPNSDEAKQDSANAGAWRCVELVCDSVVGYGDYVVFLASRIDNLDRNTVFSMTISPDSARNVNPRTDLAIRFTRWGQKSNVNALEYELVPRLAESADNANDANTSKQAERVVHYPQDPYYMNGAYSTHVMRWYLDSVRFASFHDHAFPGKWVADTWKYPPLASNANVSNASNVNTVNSEAAETLPLPTPTTSLRLMFWLFVPSNSAPPNEPNAPAFKQPVEVVVKKFMYIPAARRASQ